MIRTVVIFVSMILMAVQSYVAPYQSNFTPLPTSTAIATPPAATPAAESLITEAAVRDTLVPFADIRALTSRLKLGGQSVPASVSQPAPDRQVGIREQFWMTDITQHRYYTITAQLVAKSAHAYMYVAAGYHVSTADLQHSLQTFESKIYPTNHKYFGSEWTPGVDNDPRITILNTPISGAGGYFSQADEFLPQVNPYSNMREMIYIATPPGNDEYDGTIAHEFQHMIEFNENPDQGVWLNEGSSELAMWLNSYSVGGTDSYFLLNPDVQLNAWGSDPNQSVSHYGAAYLFLRYLTRLYGPDFIHEIVKSRQSGIASVEAALKQHGEQRDFNSLFKDWVVANWINNQFSSDPRYGYGDGGLINVQRKAAVASYPTHQQATAHQYAARYYALSGSGSDVTIAFSGSNTVKVIGNQPPAGNYEWWSNREDAVDSSLSHDFDFSNVSGPISLKYNAWYDIEKGFDYAYVDGSSDGGKTWQTLPATHTSDYNPYGNSYGNGYTGISGSDGSDASKAQWLNESVDLSVYAGKQIKLRFELITDGAYNAQGMAIDQISIPAIGYRADAAQGDGGWQAAGWLRIYNQMPQRYIVQVVELMADGSYKVVDMPIGADGKGSLTITHLGSDVQSAALIVAPYAPKTTQQASYSVDFSAK